MPKTRLPLIGPLKSLFCVGETDTMRLCIFYSTFFPFRLFYKHINKDKILIPLLGIISIFFLTKFDHGRKNIIYTSSMLQG